MNRRTGGEVMNYKITLAGEESFYMILSEEEYRGILLLASYLRERNIVDLSIEPAE
jgi:hypothetical protein